MENLATLYNEMNIFLADQIVLAMKIHNVHWNITGSKFFTLHVKMDEYYEEAQERIDESAERLLAIGANPIGSLKEVLEVTTLKELADKKVQGRELVEILVEDFSQIRNHVLHLIEIAEEVKDPGTADYFTGVAREFEKELWMLNAYLKEE